MAIINVRVDDNVKTEVENIYKEIGLNMSTAINLFLKKCILENGIPFNLMLPNKETIEALREAEKIATDPNVKSFKTVEEVMEELER